MKAGRDRPADWPAYGMRTQRPLQSPRLPKKPPTACATRESIIWTVSHAHTTTILCVFCAQKCKHSCRRACKDIHKHAESHSSSFSQLPYPLVALSIPQQVPLFLQGGFIVLLSKAGRIFLHLIPQHFDAQSPHLFLIPVLHLPCSGCKIYIYIVKKGQRNRNIPMILVAAGLA